MDVVVAGGHGKVGRRLLRLLAERGDRARGLVRNPDHAPALERLGAEPVICDLEREADIGPFVAGADAVVFSAGAGPGSGPERKRTVDLGGALKLIEAAKSNGIRRYVMVSAMGAADPSGGSDAMRPYLDAKAEADAALEGSGLDSTIVRAGGLTDEPGTGRVTVGFGLDRGSVARDDVAATLLAALDEEGTIGKTFELIQGDTPIEDALRRL